MAKSKIIKGINRKIQTKTFEQVDIICQIEEEISWESLKEREKKTQKVTDILIEDFKKTYNEVVNTLGVDRCIGSVSVEKKQDGVEIPKNNKKNDELEFNFD